MADNETPNRSAKEIDRQNTLPERGSGRREKGAAMHDEDAEGDVER